MMHWGRRQRRGAAMVEFILIFPILMLFLMAILEFGLLALDVLTAREACAVGAREAALGKPVDAIKSAVIGRAPMAGHAEAIVIQYFPRQVDSNGRELDGWQSKPRTVENVSGGAANNIPTGALIRVEVTKVPHRMVTGSFFSWLPSTETDWDVENGKSAPKGQGTTVFLFRAEASQTRGT